MAWGGSKYWLRELSKHTRAKEPEARPRTMQANLAKGVFTLGFAEALNRTFEVIHVLHTPGGSYDAEIQVR